MKNPKSAIITASLFCFIMICTAKNDSFKDTLSSTIDSVNSTKAVKTSDVAKVVNSAIKDPQKELINVYKEIIVTMKANGSLSKLNKYIYSETGLYMIYTGKDNFSDYEKCQEFPSANGDKDAGSDDYQIFQSALAKIETSLNLYKI